MMKRWFIFHHVAIYLLLLQCYYYLLSADSHNLPTDRFSLNFCVDSAQITLMNVVLTDFALLCSHQTHGSVEYSRNEVWSRTLALLPLIGILNIRNFINISGNCRHLYKFAPFLMVFLVYGMIRCADVQRSMEDDCAFSNGPALIHRPARTDGGSRKPPTQQKQPLKPKTHMANKYGTSAVICQLKCEATAWAGVAWWAEFFSARWWKKCEKCKNWLQKSVTESKFRIVSRQMWLKWWDKIRPEIWDYRQ